MKQEQGGIVSDASELLFEDIKKLNAQQRPDVPTCLIYAPISLLPMSTKHQHISTFLNHSEENTLSERCSCCFCCCFVWNFGTTLKLNKKTIYAKCSARSQ